MTEKEKVLINIAKLIDKDNRLGMLKGQAYRSKNTPDWMREYEDTSGHEIWLFRMQKESYSLVNRGDSIGIERFNQVGIVSSMNVSVSILQNDIRHYYNDGRMETLMSDDVVITPQYVKTIEVPDDGTGKQRVRSFKQSGYILMDDGTTALMMFFGELPARQYRQRDDLLIQ